MTAGGAGLVLAGLTDPFRAGPARAAVTTADLVVYGATSGGLAAAITMRRLGRTAVVVEPTSHVGGLSTAGLGATDTGVQASIGGLAAEFYRRVYVKYHGGTLTTTSPLRMTFEPHVAATVFAEMLAEAGVPVIIDARLSGVGRSGDRITELRTEDGSIYRGGVFVDATYEGDLLAMAGVGFTVGRESNDTYGETINGVQSRNTHQFAYPIDPYVTAGSPASGLLPGISATPLARRSVATTGSRRTASGCASPRRPTGSRSANRPATTRSGTSCCCGTSRPATPGRTSPPTRSAAERPTPTTTAPCRRTTSASTTRTRRRAGPCGRASSPSTAPTSRG
ncbi:FAD-dependent oxidoreductase [Micromonospora sp. M12]